MNPRHPKKNNPWSPPENQPLDDDPSTRPDIAPPRDRYGELRDLIVGPEQQQINEIRKRLDDPLRKAEEISRALPDALLLGTSRDNRIAEALQPAVDAALKTSVRKNPRALAEAIYPSLGPGIRKAVSAALMGMIQSLNRMLDSAFSLQGIRWRLEAFRSHRSFAEVVLLHALIYRVEQIFLIHRATGLVLQHVQSMEVDSKDPDLVSGMLTAIQDFVADSFQSDIDSPLTTLRMGSDLSIWIEQGQHALLAAIIRGTPPMAQRDKLGDILEEIHNKWGGPLGAFQGDTAPFIVVKNKLEEGLDYQIKTGRPKTSPLLWGIVFLILIGIGYFYFQTRRVSLQWNDFMQRLKTEPGIVVTGYGKENGRYYVSGLKDPLAKDPAIIQATYPFSTSEIIERWKPYHAVDPEIVLIRADKVLSPPQTVHLSFVEGCLTAEGAAGHDWISAFKQKAETIAGIDTVDSGRLVDEDLTSLETAGKQLEALTVAFPKGSHLPTPGQEEILGRVLSAFRELQAMEKKLAADIQIVITGHADPTGSENYNRRLSRDRADFILTFLVKNGINPSNITALGIGGEISGFPGGTRPDDTVSKRITSFKTIYDLQSMGTGQ